MADVGSGDASNKVSSSMSTQEKALRNKRKYLPEFSLDIQNDASVSLTEFPRYELLAEKFQNTLSDPGSLEAQSNWPKEEQEVEELQLSDWDDPIACQLEELLSHNLSATFRSAIKKIAECGYSEEVAEWAFLRSGLYYGSKDPVSNIVDDALVFLRREKEFDTSKHHVFKDLENLVEYTMLEMIYVLKEVKPCLTVAEAMWFLLICDLNLAQACALEGDPLSGFGGKEIPGESSTDFTLAQLKPEALNSEATHSTPHNTYISKPSISDAQFLLEIPAVRGIPKLSNPTYPFVHEVTTPGNETLVPVPDSGGKSLGIAGESVMDEKSRSSRKGRLVNSKRDILRQKSCHLEKSYKVHVSKGTFRAKLATWGGLLLDKKLKSPSDSLGVNMRNTSSKTSSASVAHNSATCFPKDIVSALPAASAKLYAALPPEKEPTPKPQVSVPGPKLLDYYAGIPYDKSLGKYVPLDEKDKLILTLVPQLQELQKELQGWTAWANEKVMQTARRLSKDQAELKKLRQEKEETEKFKKENQVFEESTLKRLAEMEYALANATGQVEMANSAAHKLEEENSILKKEMETARLQAIGSAANLQEALLREQEALKRAQSWETQKSLLLEEVSTDKRMVAELQHLLEKAKGLYDQIEARHKQEERVKEKHLIAASSIIKEREQQESLAKAEEDMIRQKAENEMQKYKKDIKKLESKLSELRLESEFSKIAALRRGINGSYRSYLMDCKDAPAFKGYQAPKVTKRLAVFRDNFGARSARVERECVMCLTEEMSVVFLPCAHQVLCANCNELHEKQVPKIEPSPSFDCGDEDYTKAKQPIDYNLRTKSANDRPKSILKQSPLHPSSVNATENLSQQQKFSKSKLRVSINLPDNEISLKRSGQLSFVEDENEASSSSSKSRILKGKAPMRSPISFPSNRTNGIDGQSYRSTRTVLEVLRELDADILALQDVKAEEEKSMKPLADLAEALGMNYVFAESWAPEYGNAILSKWPIKRWKFQKIFDDADFRNVLKATIDVPQAGEVNFHCTHLDHLDENWRMKQINAIIQSSDRPHILVGGLNSLDETDYSPERWTDIVKFYEEMGKPTPKVEVMRYLKSKQYTDAKDFAGECEPVVMIAKGQSVQGTCKYGTRVDYIFASSDSPYKFVPGSYSVFSSKGTSDHHIVKVDILKSDSRVQQCVNRKPRQPKQKIVKITNSSSSSSSSKGIWKIHRER